MARPRHACRDAAATGAGSKWTITAFAEWMARQGHDFEALWGKVRRAASGRGSQHVIQHGPHTARNSPACRAPCLRAVHALDSWRPALQIKQVVAKTLIAAQPMLQ